MPHFYIKPEDIQNNRFTIRGKEIHHIQNVLKKKIGDYIRIFDGNNHSYLAQIDSIHNKEISGKLIKDINNTSSSFLINLFQGIPKGQKIDFIIEKCTELGVTSITPILCERCVKKITQDRSILKYQRWNNIARSASQQCGRSNIPKINPLESFSEIIKKTDKKSIQFLPWEGETKHTLKETLRLNKDRLSRQSNDSIQKIINIWIGPEGGFTLDEVHLAQKYDIHTVTLGKRILRTETAGMIALALIQYELDIL